MTKFIKCILIFLLMMIIIFLACFFLGNEKQKAIITKENTMQLSTINTTETRKTMTYSVKEIPCSYEEFNIYGECYIPETEEKVPLIIFAHGLSDTYENGKGYAEYFAQKGFAVYCFDFRGGSAHSKSDGTTMQMSILTEVEDLKSVIQTAKTWEFVNTNQIFLLGTSQGGVVSAITAAELPEDIKGLVLCYPAFVMPDIVHGLFATREEITDQFNLFGWIDVGRKYAEDIWDFNVYDKIKTYTKPVYILHGDKDTVVPITYSERAQEVYPNATLKVMQGVGHGFEKESLHLAAEYIESNIKEILKDE